MKKPKSALGAVEKYLGECPKCKTKLRVGTFKTKEGIGIGLQAVCPKCGWEEING